MTYIVLARKWRPKTFDEVVGQEHVTQTLQNAIRENRLGHAFIFSGPRGVGKTTIARLLARAVNLPDPQKDLAGLREDDGKEQTLDLIEIDGASNRGIDEIRNLRENIRFAPVSSRYKVYIIDEVHMLSKDAFNALLKTLEEPPGHALFIFATTEIHRVPPTILSRCQRFDFKRLTTAQLVGQLAKIAGAENIDIAEDALTIIARKAEGGMRDATSILDQISSLGKGHIDLETVQKALGIIHHDLFFRFTELMHHKDDAAIIAFAQDLFRDGHDVMNFLQGLVEHFRNLLVTRASGSGEILELADQIRSAYEKAAPLFEVNDLLHYSDLLIQNEQLLKFSENPQLILELLLLKLAHKPLAFELEELLALLKQNPGGGSPQSGSEGSGDGPGSGGLPVKPSGGTPRMAPSGPEARPSPPSPVPTPGGEAPKQPPAGDMFASLKKISLPGNGAPPMTVAQTQETPPEAETPPPVSATPAIALETLQAKWDEVIDLVKAEKVGLASFLQEGVPYALNGNIIDLVFDRDQTFHIGHVSKNEQLIVGILKKIFGTELSFHARNFAFSDLGIEKKIVTAEDLFEDMRDKEPVLKKIIDLFDCENIDDKK